MTRKFTFLILALFALISGPGWGQTRDNITLTAESGFPSSYTDKNFTIGDFGFSCTGTMYNGKHTFRLGRKTTNPTKKK